MAIYEIFVLAAALSMDAFAVSICKGLEIKENRVGHSLTLAFFFGLFQAVMPFLGWLAGSVFSSKVEAVDHWIAFVLLAFIGGRMIYESFSSECETGTGNSAGLKEILLLAIATSIDAFAAGITFAVLPGANIPLYIAIIGITTFLICFPGAYLGAELGCKAGNRATLIGGLVLIFIGVRILLTHMLPAAL